MPTDDAEEPDSDDSEETSDDEDKNSAISFLLRTRNAQARVLLGDSRLSAFLKWAREVSDLEAPRVIGDEIAGGAGLDILIRGDAELKYVLNVESIGVDRFKIEFGCRPSDWEGDGGVWDVTFDSSGRVQDGDLERCWDD